MPHSLAMLNTIPSPTPPGPLPCAVLSVIAPAASAVADGESTETNHSSGTVPDTLAGLAEPLPCAYSQFPFRNRFVSSRFITTSVLSTGAGVNVTLSDEEFQALDKAGKAQSAG